ncbi:MAG TPA: ribonuclease P protein component, partial [Catalimonadaceae bacterium]|nr:ribonuclease P protein component [Catalimonadaceae bacterium]
MKTRNTFSKPERLCSRKSIEQLFETGEKWVCFPFRIIIRLQNRDDSLEPEAAPVQILVSASKRNFKQAVDRNRIKRQIREAYRLHKHLLYSQVTNRL